MSCSRRLLSLLTLSVVFTACGRKQPEPPPHYAAIGFENLSGDASLDWLGRGAGEFLSRSLSGSVLSEDAVDRAIQTLGAHPLNAPGGSAARIAAIVAGANRIITGYIERTAGGVRITASEEDVATHQTDRTLSATATAPVDALNLLAHEFSASPAPPPTKNAEAFRLYSTALGGPAADAVPLLERAVALDPAFGRAWVVLTRTFVALGNHASAQGVIQQARASKIAPVDLAWIDFEAAALAGDKSATLAAMRKASEFDPADAGLARTLAEADTAAGNFSQAASYWKKTTVNTPDDVNAWNQLGYTLAWSGDYSGALAALREYARLRPNEANPIDSQGDVNYWFGKFADAADSYSAANAKTPGFLNGGELYKAAWARFLAGDKTAADALFARFKEEREKAKGPGTEMLTGDWLYRTGRVKEAVTLLRDASKNASSTTPAIHNGIAVQLALWDLLAGDRAAAGKDIASGASSQTGGLTSGDVLVRFAAMPTASPAEWEARAARFFATPQLDALRSTALGYALILDGKKKAAIPVWEQIVKQSPGTDFFPRAMLARLKGQPLEHRAPPDPVNLNQFAAVVDKL